MANNYRMDYGVDLVFCIDAPMSMDHILDTVKNNALNFYQDFKAEMDRKHKRVAALRIRIVAFRDYYYDREKAMLVTGFFNLPEQAEEFRACINSIKADGGGDDPEDGLEAHELGFGKAAPNYPRGMAKDFNELTAWWGSKSCPGVMDESAKRLIIFAPDKPGWNTISDNWNNVIQYESEAGSGLEDCDYEQILSAICNSI